MTRLRLAAAAAAALLLATAALPAAAQQDRPFGAAEIEAATFTGADLAAGRSPLTAKVQMLLDRSGISPGVTDGFKGGMSQSAIRAFERQRGLPIDGILDAEVWAQLQAFAAEPVTQTYTITEADAADLVDKIPTDYAEKAQMTHMGYTSLAEKLGERFHMDEKFVAFLNPGVTLAPGATITVMRPAPSLKARVARILVDKAARRVAAYDARGRLVADYPATIGSTETPSPSGTHKVARVALNPDYTYNPKINFKQGDNDKVLKVPPGPNGPVGTVWVALDKPTYGIHGTPTPSRLFVNESKGCVRLTNWDAWELAHMVTPGATVVEFLPPGTGITDVIPAVPAPAASGATVASAAGSPPPPAHLAGTRPRLRPASILAAAAAGGTGTATAATGTATTATGATAPGTATAAPADAAAAAQPATAQAAADLAAAQAAAAASTAAEAAASAAPTVIGPMPPTSGDPLAAALQNASGGAAPVLPVVTPTPTPTPGG